MKAPMFEIKNRSYYMVLSDWLSIRPRHLRNWSIADKQGQFAKMGPRKFFFNGSTSDAFRYIP